MNHQLIPAAKESKTDPSKEDTLSGSVLAVHSYGRTPKLHDTAKSEAFLRTVHTTCHQNHCQNHCQNQNSQNQRNSNPPSS
ncbi:hypothetical protein F511_26894 [Dorcoceras hygrometricum]|uniref:Uncharacterized protein n=1 Tax=Dorcoceras hygrometricum TaxID=472368 RepID=A0A2Z7B423_9LAMI|nr:hypothetical protein F511_26894 [Dorcoceras hygrometricum]